MPNLRGALIGCGYVSQFHLEAWTRQSLGRLVAVCDLDSERAKAACRHGVCTAYTDAAEMFAVEGIQKVMNVYNPDATGPEVD